MARDARFVANVVGVEYRSDDSAFNERKAKSRLIGALLPYQDYPEVREELKILGFRFRVDGERVRHSARHDVALKAW